MAQGVGVEGREVRRGADMAGDDEFGTMESPTGAGTVAFCRARVGCFLACSTVHAGTIGADRGRTAEAISPNAAAVNEG